MKEKETITKDNYKENTLKRAIIVCWVLLVICFVIKICGGNFFNIICRNENFIKFCDFIDNSVIMYIIYLLCFLFTSTMLLFIANGSTKIKTKNYCLFLISVIIVWIVKLVLDLSKITANVFFMNFIYFILLYIVLALFSKNKLKPLFCIIYDLLLTVLSVFIKSFELYSVITNSFLITTIYLIDYYILLLITALYSKLKYERRN